MLVLPIVYLFVFGMTYVLGGNVLATVTVYKDYRGLKTIYSQVDKILGQNRVVLGLMLSLLILTDRFMT